MRYRARYLLAVTLVATALCADRATATVADARPQIGQLAEKLVARLTRSFRRTVPTVSMFAERRTGLPANSVRSIQLCQAARRRFELSPHQFPLPPPAL
jgi:hypothetical protein